MAAPVIHFKNQQIMETKVKIEETPLLQAQQLCKEALIRTGNAVLTKLTALKEQGVIEDVQYELGTYNAGYDIRFKVIADWTKLDSSPLSCFIGQTYHSISLQPGIFFNDNFTEGVASLKGEMIKTKREQEMNFPMQGIGTMQDVERLLEGYEKETIERLAMI